jgi:glc operon protein GlcG
MATCLFILGCRSFSAAETVLRLLILAVGGGRLTMILTEALKIVDGAITWAREINARISVTMCDESGRLIALHRMDHVFAEANQGSIGKAIAAVATGRPSGETGISADFPLQAGTVLGEGAPFIQRQGGLPIFRNGVLEGACGVSGGKDNEQDEDCARAGLRALHVNKVL